MDRTQKERLIDILYLIIFLIVVVIWGSSFVMTIIDYNDVLAIVCVISYVMSMAGIFLLEKHTNRYKWKYLILGKKFKKQVNEFFVSHEELSKKDKKRMLKGMKDTYRKTGSIRFAVFYYQTTPYKLLTEDYDAFSYGNALDEQKIEYMLYSLRMNTDIGGGLYRFFEDITREPFSYDEYKKLITNSKLFSKELKELLLKKDYKKIFEYFKRYDTLNDDEHNELEIFELNDSNLIAEFDVELFSTVEKIAVERYLDLKKSEGLIENVESAYISKDKTKRISIYKNQDTNVYKTKREEFVFYDIDSSRMHSEGGWLETQTPSSVYDSVETALKDIEVEIKDYEKLK